MKMQDGVKTAHRATLSAVIIRADGTRIELGNIARWHRHWWMRAWYRIEDFFKK